MKNKNLQNTRADSFSSKLNLKRGFSWWELQNPPQTADNCATARNTSKGMFRAGISKWINCPQQKKMGLLLKDISGLSTRLQYFLWNWWQLVSQNMRNGEKSSRATKPRDQTNQNQLLLQNKDPITSFLSITSVSDVITVWGCDTRNFVMTINHPNGQKVQKQRQLFYHFTVKHTLGSVMWWQCHNSFRS